MLSDYWVIAQLLGQVCTVALLSGGVYFSIQLLKGWKRGATSEKQLHLERQSYLVSSIAQFALFFQLLLIVMFLNTVNLHLTGQIEGAMCASGVLDINDYGYPLLYLKIGSLLGYAIYLILNYFDQQEPEYPLTPLKFWCIFPAFGLMLLDFIWTFQFFSEIKPDIIATCCSVSFLAENSSPYSLSRTPENLGNYLVIWGSSSVVLLLMSTFWQKSYANLRFWAIQIILGIVYLALSVYVLKHFFVKYIYGLPSHNCLFDIFWAKYYYIGYILFGSYFGVLYCLLVGFIYQLFVSRLQIASFRFWQKLRVVYIFFLLCSFVLPWFYWYFWKGVL
jgi:hypothetical protein